MRMFYRSKLLLGLLEAFGGDLEKTDCQKLVFLFCQRSGNNYYDFFPYKYGCFSTTINNDKNRLVENGFLKKGDSFKLSEAGDGFITQLNQKDQQILTKLVKEIGTLRGRMLVKKVYLEYPEYASHSEIAKEVLTEEEYINTEKTWIVDNKPALFTLGYEGLSIDAYFHQLLSHNVKALVDVRKNPYSMKEGFTKAPLAKGLARIGINYYHLPDLGVPSHLRQNLDGDNDYSELFRYYDREILPNQPSAIKELKDIIENSSRVALTCFESNPCNCHRHRLTTYLENSNDFALKATHLPIS